jgi:hypothetical protein
MLQEEIRKDIEDYTYAFGTQYSTPPRYQESD